MDWMINAACRGAPDPDLWFPVSEIGPGAVQLATAKLACMDCPVREDCLEYAQALGLDEGVFGGLAASERRELRRSAVTA